MKDINEPKQLEAFLLSIGYHYGTSNKSLIKSYFNINIRVEIFIDYINGDETSENPNYGHKILIDEKEHKKYFIDGENFNNYITEGIVLVYKEKMMEKIAKNIIKTLLP